MLGPTLSEDLWTGRTRSVSTGWWSANASGEGIVVPDGAVDLLWTAGRVPWIAGPDSRPRTVSFERETTLVGLRLQPGIAQVLLRDGVDQARDRSVPLSAVWHRCVLDQLEEALSMAPTVRHVANRLASAVDRQVPASWMPDTLVVDAAQQLLAGETAHRGGLSARQFRRRFVGAFGLSPAFYGRIARLSRFTDLLDQGPHATIAELAGRCGYFDESHLSRDCTELLSATPGQLRRHG